MSQSPPTSLFSKLTPETKKKWLDSLTPAELEANRYFWRELHARPTQLEPVWTQEQIAERGGDWRIWVACAGRGFGKGFAYETPIPTPTGWTTMGALSIGDVVFDEAGKPCNVTAVFEQVDVPCYKFTFSDGAELVVDETHQWVTWTHAERKAFLRSPYEDTTKFPNNWPTWRLKRRHGVAPMAAEKIDPAIYAVKSGMSARDAEVEFGISRHTIAKYMHNVGSNVPKEYANSPGPQVRTAKEIFETQVFGKRGDTNHCIPNCGQLDLPELDLPVAPYTMGYWLGNGSKKDGSITAHDQDAAHVRSMIETDGYKTTDRSAPFMFGTIGLMVDLDQCGALGGKRLPRQYLRASAPQRLALLRGLMDSDGGVDFASAVSFSNTIEALCDDVMELARSLGQKPTKEARQTYCMYKGQKVAGAPSWRISWTSTVNPFSSPRKTGHLVACNGQSLRNHHRMIVSVDRVPSVPTKCITVDSPNSMYLAGAAMIPSHNTKLASEWVREKKNTSGRIALIGETARDVRDTMILGKSGIVNISPPWDRPTYNPSNSKLTWPNGAIAQTFSAEEPDSLRGPEFNAAWWDEAAKCRYQNQVHSNLQMCLRIGKLPRTLITTTPRPTALLKKIMASPLTHVTRGSTYDNRDNLSAGMFDAIREEFEGTRAGRQEIYGEIVEDISGALWTYEIIEGSRLKRGEETPDLDKIAIGVDPSGSKDGDECGIVAAGYNDEQRRAFVLADVSFQASAQEWGEASVRLYHELDADVIVVESNYGGDMTERTLRAAAEDMNRRGEVNSRGIRVPKIITVLKTQSTAKKAARAFPVAQQYQQGRVAHAGEFIKLEAEMREMTQTWERGRDKSPNRVDALVFAVRECIDYARDDGSYFEII